MLTGQVIGTVADERRHERAAPILVRAPPGTRTREFLAILHRLAADVEQATQESETWHVRVDCGGFCLGADGRVFIDLDRTDDAVGAEAIRGLLTLQRAVQRALAANARPRVR